MAKANDRREQERRACDGVPAIARWLSEGMAHGEQGEIRDISLAGCSLRLAKAPCLGRLTRLSMSFGVICGEPVGTLEAGCKVVRREMGPDGYVVALAFETLPPRSETGLRVALRALGAK